jgi:hypothetical protein
MMSRAVRFFVAMLAVAVVGCSSSNHGGRSGAGGKQGGSQGNAGTTVSSGGSGGGVGTEGIIGSAGSAGSAGMIASGGTPYGGATAGNAGNCGGGPTGGATKPVGAGGGPASSGGVAGDDGGRGGTSAISDAGDPIDANTDVDAPTCPVCPAMRCTYGSPVDSNGCTLCTCNPEPDGGIDISTPLPCGLPEGCADAGRDNATQSEAGGKSDVIRFDGTGVKCGDMVCAWGEHCCGSEGEWPSTPTCAPANDFCV